MEKDVRFHVDDVMGMAIKLHQGGEFEGAETLYKDILDEFPEHPDALHYSGMARHQKGDSDAGVAKIVRSLELAPENPSAWNNLGNIYREIGNLEDAELAYAKVLEVSPDHADTLVNLATILRGLKQPEDALVQVTKALKIDPKHVQAHHNLGNIYCDLGKFEEAISAYHKSAEFSPEGENDLPRVAVARVLRLGGRVEEAIEVLELQLKEKPDDAKAQHMLAAYSGEDIPDRASDQFIRQTFDSFSQSFDRVLKRLDYKAPMLIGEKVNDYLANAGRRLHILDIGCGTGLCGPLVKPIAETLVGVDLSSGMLQKAERREVYDRLEEAELTAYMNSAPDEFDVVICADTLVYFGELDDAMKASFRTLKSGGWLFFTVEQHTSDECADGFWLRFHGRYSHANSYVTQTLEAAGFEVSATDDVVLRQESTESVRGTLVAAQKK